jgi:glutamine phosphoribosylpyrophosphate amidotransferase
MCGIVGIADLDGRPDPVLVQHMLAAVAHRGPDSEALWQGANVVIGCRRLAIIDVTGGSQPASNESGSVQVVFSGEIYNHHALRRRLLDCGHRLRNNSDTEVIPHLYEDLVSLISAGFIPSALTESVHGIPFHSPELVARRIADVIQRPQREVVVPRYYRAAIWMEAIFPRAVDRLLPLYRSHTGRHGSNRFAMTCAA